FEDGTNVIEIYIPGVKGSEIKLKSLDRSLRIADIKLKGDTITAWAMPYTTSHKMRLAVMNKKTNKVIKEIDFYGDKIPEPIARVGNLKDSVVDKKDLLNQSAIFFEYPHSLYSYPYRITEYRFTAHYSGKDISLPATGVFIPIEIKKIIKEMPSNTKVIFTDIVASCPQCYQRPLRDIKILVR
ncbi:MAG TPA: hypothetical protein VN721_06105, partial [Flavipsychrobacter sp.]|nr:hypothetical protein [Flavipsychrobacter sp.]